MPLSPLSFNFPSLPPAAETQLRRLAPWLVLALGLHAALALWPRAPRPTSRLARLSVADDTPRLLQLSRAQAATGGASELATVPVGMLPPPPPLAAGIAGLAGMPVPGGTAGPGGSAAKAAAEPGGAAGPGGAGQGAPDSRGQGRARREMPRSGAALLPIPAGLPGQAAAALDGALLLAGGEPAGAGPTDREALVALQRRQIWLTASQERWLQQLWQRAERPSGTEEDPGAGARPGDDGGGERDTPPAPPELPGGVELRWLSAPLPAAGLAPLGPGDPHGSSLVGRRQLLLIWRQNGRLWLLRAGLPRSGKAATAG